MTPLRSRVLLVVLLCAGCGADDPPNYPQTGTDGGIASWEGMGWPDYGSSFTSDWWQPPTDQGSTDDAGVADDDSGSSVDCEGPSVSCTGCAGDEICTEASGGTCAKRVELKGPASDPAVRLAVALAYIECWNRQPSSDTLCATFDTCEMIGTLTASMVEDWVCNMAQVSEFPSAAAHEKAQELCGCSWYGYTRPDWIITSAASGEQGLVCLTYDVNAWMYYDHLNVDHCKQYPP